MVGTVEEALALKSVEAQMAKKLRKASARRPYGFVYRLFNDAGELLYIGKTVNPFSRPWAHLSQKPWGNEVDLRKVDLKEFPSEEEAKAAETEAIIREKPKYNKRVTYATRLSDDQVVQLHRALDIAWAEILKTDIDPTLGNLIIQEAKNRVLRAFRQ
jgi:predicted GIY-YIG superfamily endonuclease